MAWVGENGPVSNGNGVLMTGTAVWLAGVVMPSPRCTVHVEPLTAVTSIRSASMTIGNGVLGSVLALTVNETVREVDTPSIDAVPYCLGRIGAAHACAGMNTGSPALAGGTPPVTAS